ncbi:MAG: hypothetical protein CL613_02535 [Aquimarina sp.]|nr:hypothetical protein [Aquimarina sp.]
MKTIILSVFAVSFAMVSYSQEIEFNGFSKGDFVISGSVNYYHRKHSSEFIRNGESSNDEYKTKNISIIPEIEHFINQNISLGLRAGYLFSANENNILDSKNTDEGYLLGIFGKYYFNTKKRISFFTETSLS